VPFVDTFCIGHARIGRVALNIPGSAILLVRARRAHYVRFGSREIQTPPALSAHVDNKR